MNSITALPVGYLVLRLADGEAVVIDGTRFEVDFAEPALLAPDGRRLSLAGDAVVEAVPGVSAQCTTSNRPGLLALRFGGRSGVLIRRERIGRRL